MAKYRSIQTRFWSDSKVIDDFTPEDRYFYLYLLTNEKSNQLGCYELSIRQICRDTGYNEETVKKLIKRFEDTLNVINYDFNTKEIFIRNWHKYNWLDSYNTKKCIEKEFDLIKSEKLIELISPLYTPYIPHASNKKKNKKKKNNKKNNNNKNNIGEKEDKNTIILSLIEDGEIQERLKDFLEMRKLIKKPMTERAIKQLINKLCTLSEKKEEQLEILDQSIINNWASVYPLKNNNFNNKHQEKTPNWFDKEQKTEKLNDEEQQEMDDILNNLI